MQNINLIIQYNLKLKLVFYANWSYFFLSFYKNVEIIIKKLKIRYSIFVFEQKDYNLILSQTFLNFANLAKNINQIVFLALLFIYIFIYLAINILKSN